MSNYEHNHPAARSAWVKYGPRHSAHLQCAIEKQGDAFIRNLPDHRLEALPFFEIRALGMEHVMREEITKRPRLQGSNIDGMLRLAEDTDARRTRG
jgi:hypothetical protein